MGIEGTAINRTVDPATGADGLRVFWMPGCSSCVKVKEFLKKLGVPYESVNVLTNPNAETDLRGDGRNGFPGRVARPVSSSARSRWTMSPECIGRDVKFERLSPPELMDRWFYFSDTALEMVDRIPQEHLQALPIPNRNRTFHGLSYHIFQVPEAFLENAENGEEHFDKYFDSPPPDDVTTSVHVRAYGDRITARLRRHWQSLPDRSFGWTVKTFYGIQPSHHFLERSVWHMAQHIQRLQVVLDSYNVTLKRRIDEAKYKGLPMPDGIWE